MMQIMPPANTLPAVNTPANPAQPVPVAPVAAQAAVKAITPNAVAAPPKGEAARKKLSNEERAKGGEKSEGEERALNEDDKRGKSVNLSI